MNLGLRMGWLVASALLVLAGCNDNGAMTTDAATGGDSGGSDAGASNTIADIASSNPDFSMLVAAADRAGIVGTLAGPGSYTVFAPTNDAFAASGITMAMIESMPMASLQQILTYHALATEVRSTDITAGPVTSLANLSIILGTTGGVTLNGGNAVTGGANVVMADIEADNGIIHVIDRVLLPPDVPALARYAGLTSLVDAVTSAGLGDALSAAGPFTVFAPTNAAFAELPAVPTGDALSQVLLFHVVAGSVASSAVPAMAPSLATNEYGDALTLLFDTSSGVTIDGSVHVVVADVLATNGVVHVVDHVILPMNVVDAATAAGLTGLTGAVGAAAPLTDGTTVAAALSAQAPYTVFAPTNEAFTAASGVIAGLSAAQVRDVLLYHVLSTTTFTTPVLAADLPTADASLDTLNGAAIPFVAGPPPTVDGAGIVITDIGVTNGVVHVIDAVMVP